MAGKRPKTAVRSRQTRAVQSERNFPWLRVFCGWVILIFPLVVLLGAVSRSYGSAEQNWMGPYLGEVLVSNLELLLGRFPMLGYMLALWGSGVVLLLGRKGNWARWTISTWGLSWVIQVVLSLRLEISQVLARVHFVNHGGMIGVFWVKHLIIPVFGDSRVGPYLILSALTLAFLIWGYGLQMTRLWALTRELGRALWNRWLAWKEKRRNPDVAVDWPTPETSDFPLVRRGEVRPFQAEALVEPLPQTVRYAEESLAVRDQQAIQGAGACNNAIMRIEEKLRNAQNMDPREVRALRDELVELRRIQSLNAWEDQKAGAPRIEGIVRGNVDLSDQTKTMFHDANVQPQPRGESRTDITLPMADMPPKQKAQEQSARSETNAQPYVIPRVADVLPAVPFQPVDYSAEELQQFSRQLEEKLEDFRVKGKVVGIAAGPVITRFEVEPGPGIKVSRFAGLSDDLALALKASAIRILAPIPGKALVGIEIPNRKAQIVYCREILESPRFMPSADTLQIALGKDITGNAYVMDLARAPHLLIAGQTGSGKSVCINTLMASLLFSKSPDDLRMILVDPKVVELKAYENIPHLLHPVVTDPATAVQALQWACWEMDRRYEVLAKAKVRNISGFNQKAEKGELPEVIEESDRRRMPYIVIVIDEFADVIMQAKKEFEDPVIRLAQKARACGIHLVLATQRPSANVITGVIKANLPTRISFKVASHIDARTVMDHAGAERLLGRGDMLFRSIDDPEPVRVHGAYLSDADAERVAASCAEQGATYARLSSFIIDKPAAQESDDLLQSGPKDPLFWEAAQLVVESGGGSTSMLQRRLSIGYARAGRLMDLLYQAGIVGPERGSKPRDVLITEEELANLRRTK